MNLIRWGISGFAIVYLMMLTACSAPKKQTLEPENLSTLSADSLTTLIARYPGYAQLYYHRGKQYEAINQLNPALTDYKQALTIDSLTADYYFAAADLFLRAGQSEQTLNLLLKANKLIPKNAQILYRLANLYFYVTNYKAANEYLAQTLETDPYFAPAYLTRALIQRENGDTAQAIINLQVAVERNPQYYEAYMVLASLCAQTLNNLAVNYYKNALALQPNSYEAYYGLAMYYQQTGTVNLALDWYDTLLVRLGPNLPHVHFNKGYIYMIDYQQYDSAIACFNHSLTLNPEYAEACVNLAYCHEQLKQYPQSRSYYQKALTLNPELTQAQQGLERIKRKK